MTHSRKDMVHPLRAPIWGRHILSLGVEIAWLGGGVSGLRRYNLSESPSLRGHNLTPGSSSLRGTRIVLRSPQAEGNMAYLQGASGRHGQPLGSCI